MALRVVPEFATWYEREHPKVLGSVLALCGDPDVAADVTDEAFARALAHWRRVAVMVSPGGWTYRVALNGLRRKMRRRQTERRVIDTVGARTATAASDPDPHIELWEAVRALPERQRSAVVLRYVADLPEADIAAALHVSRGTVASNLSDARRSLARFLTESDERDLGVAP